MRYLLTGKSHKFWLLVILTVTFPFTCIFSQVFPLKQDVSGKYFITRTKSPFLINGYPSGELSNTDEVVKNITRLGYQGINTIYVRLLTNEACFDEKGIPQKTARKTIAALKRLLREAAMKNMFVLIHPETENTERDGSREQCLRYSAKKLKNFKHIAWVLSETDFQNEKLISGFSSKQLKGCLITGFTSFNLPNFDFVVCSDTCKVSNSPKPVVQLIKMCESPETSAESIRNMVYTAILRGACGTIVNAPFGPSFSVLNPITGNLRQMKAVFDSSDWHQWQAYPSVLSPGNIQKMKSSSVSNHQLSKVVIYHPSGAPLHLNFSDFNTKLKLTWIHPGTGIKMEGLAHFCPSEQIFLPPYQEGIKSDWLLLISPVEAPKPDKPKKRFTNREEK